MSSRGTQDIGSGTRTGLAQVAAEELGLPLAAISLQLGIPRSGLLPVVRVAPPRPPSGRQPCSAAADLKQQILEVAAALLETRTERLTIADGQVLVDGKRPGVVSVAEVASQDRATHAAGRSARALPTPATWSSAPLGRSASRSRSTPRQERSRCSGW